MPLLSSKTDAAHYIASIAAELRYIAIVHKLDVTAYLLDMAAHDAREAAKEAPASTPETAYS